MRGYVQLSQQIYCNDKRLLFQTGAP